MHMIYKYNVISCLRWQRVGFFREGSASLMLSSLKEDTQEYYHCTKKLDIRRRIYHRRLNKQHLRPYYSDLYHTVFPCNHLISLAGLSFLPHITSIPLLFGFVFVQPLLNPPLF